MEHIWNISTISKAKSPADIAESSGGQGAHSFSYTELYFVQEKTFFEVRGSCEILWSTDLVLVDKQRQSDSVGSLQKVSIIMESLRYIVNLYVHSGSPHWVDVGTSCNYKMKVMISPS